MSATHDADAAAVRFALRVWSDLAGREDPAADYAEPERAALDAAIDRALAAAPSPEVRAAVDAVSEAAWAYGGECFDAGVRFGIASDRLRGAVRRGGAAH